VTRRCVTGSDDVIVPSRDHRGRPDDRRHDPLPAVNLTLMLLLLLLMMMMMMTARMMKRLLKLDS